MQQVAKEGFLFASILSYRAEIEKSDFDWNRRWFRLHNNAILFCYDGYGGNLVKTIDLKSLTHDEVNWPSSLDGKPFVIALTIRGRDEKILLEADCKECMEKWGDMLTRYLPTEYTNLESSLTYEIMGNNYNLNKRQPGEMEGSTKLATAKTSGCKMPVSEELLNKHISSPNSSRDEELFEFNLSKDEKTKPNSFTLDRSLRASSVKGCGLEDSCSTKIYQDINYFQHATNRSQLYSDGNKFNTISYKMFPRNKSKHNFKSHKSLKMERFASAPPDKTDRMSSFHNYYEIDSESAASTLTRSSRFSISDVASSFYESVHGDLIPDNALITQSRRIESSVDQKSFEPYYLEPRSEVFMSEEEVAFLDLPNPQELLENHWLMCIVLPNGKVFTQLIDISLPIETSLKQLLACYIHSDADVNTCFSLEVIGELHHTHTTRVDTKKGVQDVLNLNWYLTFRSQGVLTSKILRVGVETGKGVELDSERLEDFLYHVSHLPMIELFSLSWVSFVRENFPELDLSVSARHSACIYIIYSRIHGSGKVDVKNFIPSPLRKLSVHLKAVAQCIEDYTSYNVKSLCETFLNEITASRCGNAISLTAKRVKIMKRKIKYYSCIVTICKKHLCVVRADVASQYDKSDTFSDVYHFGDIQGWFLNEKLNLVTIKLTEEGADGSKLTSFKTNIMHTVDLLLKDFFQVAPYYQNAESSS